MIQKTSKAETPRLGQKVVVGSLVAALLIIFVGSFIYRMQGKGMTVEIQQERGGMGGGMGEGMGGKGGPMGMMGVDMEALRELMRKMETNPEDPKILFELGNTFMMMQAWDKALEFLEHAAKNAPNDMETQKALGMVRFELKQYDQAKKIFDKVLAKNPDDALTHYNMGILLKHYMNKAGEAEPHFRKVVQLAPKDADVLKSAQEELVPAKAQ